MTTTPAPPRTTCGARAARRGPVTAEPSPSSGAARELHPRAERREPPALLLSTQTAGASSARHSVRPMPAVSGALRTDGLQPPAPCRVRAAGASSDPQRRRRPGGGGLCRRDGLDSTRTRQPAQMKTSPSRSSNPQCQHLTSGTSTSTYSHTSVRVRTHATRRLRTFLLGVSITRYPLYRNGYPLSNL